MGFGLGHGKKGGSPPGLLLEYTSLTLTNKQCSLISKKAVSCHDIISHKLKNARQGSDLKKLPLQGGPGQQIQIKSDEGVIIY